MRLIEQSKSIFELSVESLEDLWVLSQFIEPNDVIYALTERKVKIGNDNAKQVKKLIRVDLSAKKVAFESDVLRISGEILNETEFTAVGQSHSLTFKVNDSIKIEKKNPLNYEKQMLENSLKSKKTKNMIILLDKDELIATEFTNANFSVLFEKKGLGSKKQFHSEIYEEEEKYNLIKDFINRDYENIILAGPSQFKDRLSKYIKDKEGTKTIVFSFPDVNTSAVERAIKEVYKQSVLESSELGRENDLITKLLENIDKQQKFAYGFESVHNSINSGSCEKLLISTKLIQERREDGTYEDLSNLMRMAEDIRAELHIINSKNETGKVLDGLGKIASINRY